MYALAGIELGPEGGQALGKFLQGNTTLRSLSLKSMPEKRREGGEEGCGASPFFFWCLLREAACAAGAASGRGEEGGV